jgi:chromosome segregation ATPase
MQLIEENAAVGARARSAEAAEAAATASLAAVEAARQQLAVQLGQELAALRQRLEAAVEGRESAEQELARALNRTAELQGTVAALRAEFDTVKHLSSELDSTNQELVDNMCDMTGEAGVGWSVGGAGLQQCFEACCARKGRGIRSAYVQTHRILVTTICIFPWFVWGAGLIDAVQALQSRNRLVQADLDAASSRVKELQAAAQESSQEAAALREELAAAAEARAALEAAGEASAGQAAQLGSSLGALQHAHASLQEEHGRLQRDHASLQTRAAEQEAAAQAAHEAAQHAQRQAEASTVRAEQESEKAQSADARLHSLVLELDAQHAAVQEGREALEGMKREQAVLEGKLVLARQREAAFKVG